MPGSDWIRLQPTRGASASAKDTKEHKEMGEGALQILLTVPAFYIGRPNGQWHCTLVIIKPPSLIGKLQIYRGILCCKNRIRDLQWSETPRFASENKLHNRDL